MGLQLTSFAASVSLNGSDNVTINNHSNSFLDFRVSNNAKLNINVNDDDDDCGGSDDMASCEACSSDCKSDYDNDVNNCFIDFTLNDAACFLIGLWDIKSAIVCHVLAIANQLNCNTRAQAKYEACKASCH